MLGRTERASGSYTINRRMEVTRELFDLQRHRRFGTANPDRMRLAYWEWLARNKWGPYQAMQHFGVGLDTIDGPDWCFPRYGMSTTQLPDGRVIHVGGEYEDSYDAEFCIFNDVVLFGPNDEFAIFGYPRDEFPPTDFHTATFDGSRVVLIGCFGYPEDRIPGHTPVFSLDTTTYKMQRLEMAGDNPGWLYEHSAVFDSNRSSIVVRGGKVIVGRAGDQQLLRNFDDFELCLQTSQWKRLTNKRWRQFHIIFLTRQERGVIRNPASSFLGVFRTAHSIRN